MPTSARTISRRSRASDRLRANLRDLIDDLGLTQQQVADHLGWSRSAVSMFLTGHRGRIFDKLDDLADALGVSIGDLFDEPRRSRKDRVA